MNCANKIEAGWKVLKSAGASITCYEVSRFKSYRQTIRRITPHHHQRPVADALAVAFVVDLFFSNRQKKSPFRPKLLTLFVSSAVEKSASLPYRPPPTTRLCGLSSRKNRLN